MRLPLVRLLFAMFDQLMQSVQSRWIALLREVSVRREIRATGAPGHKGGGWFVIVSLNGGGQVQLRDLEVSAERTDFLLYSSCISRNGRGAGRPV
jgi:hypothetical protein